MSLYVWGAYVNIYFNFHTLYVSHTSEEGEKQGQSMFVCMETIPQRGTFS